MGSQITESVKDFAKDAHNQDALVTLINKFDNVNDAAKAMKMADVGKGMAENALNASNFGKTLDTVNEGMETFNNFSLKGKKGLKEMGKNLLSMGKGLLKTIFTPKNLLKGGVIGALVGGTAYLAKKAYDSLPSVQSKKLDKMQQSYDADAAELESLNAELDKTKDKIAELQLKGNLSLVEQDQLSKLQQQNKELERTISLKQLEQKIDSREKLDQAKSAYESHTESKLDEKVNKELNLDKIKENKNEIISKYSKDGTLKGIDNLQDLTALGEKINLAANLDDINFLIGSYQALLESKNNVDADIIEKTNLADAATGKKQKKYLAEVKKLQELSSAMDSDIAATYSDISEYGTILENTYKAYKDAEQAGTITDSEMSDMKDIENLLNDFYSQIDQSGKTIDSKINSLFAKEKYSKLEESMINAGKEGENALQKVIDENGDFVTELNASAVSVDDLKDHIMALADPDSYNMDKLKDVLKDKIVGDKDDRKSIWDNFIKGKSDEDLKTFFEYLKSEDVNPAEANWDANDVERNFRISVQGIEDVELAALSAEQLTEKVSKAQSILSNVSTALTDSLSDTGVTTETITGLTDAFGTLSSYNPEALFTNTANGVRVNNKALERLVKTQHEADSADLEKRIQKQNELWKEQNEILNSSEYNEGAKKAAEEQMKSAEDAIFRMKQAQAQMGALYKEQMKQFSDFQAIQNAKNTPNGGDQYNAMLSEIKSAKEAYDKGLTGTDDFKTVAAYLSPNGFEDPANFIENYNKATRYFTEDRSGVVNFLNDLKSKGLATLTTLSDGTQQWAYSFEDVEKAAHLMGMGEEFFRDVLGRGEDYGLFNTFAETAQEAEQNVEDLSDKLAEAYVKKAELEASGASDEAIATQQAEIDKLTGQYDATVENRDTFEATSGRKRVEDIKEAIKQIESLGKEVEKLDKAGRKDAAKGLQEKIKDIADTYDLSYDDSYKVNASSAKDAFKATGVATWETPKSITEMGLEFGTKEARDYASTLKTLKAAHDENNEATEKAFQTLSNYNAEQLEGIQLGDGAYNVEGMEQAEDALQLLADSYGLTIDQLKMGLEGLGVLKPEVDLTDITQLNTTAEEAQKKLNEMNGTTYEFDFETSDLDTINKQIEQASQQLEQFRNTDGTYNYEQDGAAEAAQVYKAAIAQQQQSEYNTSTIGQSTSTDSVVNAVQKFMQAKNELDLQTELASQGLENDVEGATKAAQSAFETLKAAGGEDLIDMTDIQAAEDGLLALTDEDLKVKLGVDSTEVDSKLDSITHDKLTKTIDIIVNNTGMEESDAVNELLAMGDQDLMTTVGCNADEVYQVRQELMEMDNQQVNIAIELDNTQFAAIINAIQGNPVQVPVEAETGEMESEIESSAEGVKPTVEIEPVMTKSVSDVVGSSQPSASVNANVNVETGDSAASIEAISAAIGKVNGKTVPVKANVMGKSEVEELSSAIQNVNGRIVSVGANVSGTGDVLNLSSAIRSLRDRNVTITTTHISKGKSTGTMTSVAHADGTAYNVLNSKPLSPAHANGQVALEKDEKALVNEIGTESIVRNGVWSLLPGGAHFETLKKGDIIFSASQTKALLEHGKIAGHARAFADGTLSTQAGNYYGLYKAYASGPMQGGGVLGGGPVKPSSSTKPSTNTQNANTNSTKDNTIATNDNTKATKKSTQVYDWVARKLEYFANKTKAIADTITDWVSSATKKNLLYKQVNATNDEMHVNYNAARTYYNKAASLGLDRKTRKLIEEGKYNIEDIDTSTDAGKAKYDKITEYQKYYDEYTKCIDAVRELRKEQVELFAQWAAMPTEEAEKKIDELTKSYNGLTAIQARLSAADMGGSTQAALMKQLEATYKTATNNKKSADSKRKTASDKLFSAKSTEKNAKKTASKDKKSLSKATKNLRNGTNLSDVEKKRIASGQTLSTKGLKGKKKRLVQQYNSALKKNNASQKAYKSAKSNSSKAQSAYNTANVNKKANDAIYTEYLKSYDQARKAYNAGNSLSYQNYLVDAELANTKAQNDARQTAYQQASRNTQTAVKRNQDAQNKKTSIQNRGKAYSKKYAKYLSASQEKQLAAGKKVNPAGIKNKKVLNLIKKYNADLQNAINSAVATQQQLTAAQEAESEAAANAAQSQAEYAQAQIEAEQKKFDNIEKYYNKRIDYQKAIAESQEKERELSEAHGNYTKSSDYDSQIKSAQEAQKLQAESAKKLQEQLDKSVKSGVIKQNSDEWLEMKTQIIEAENAVKDYNTQIEQLKQQQITVKYEEMFDRAIAKAEQFKDKLETINSLITEEMMYDYDTGFLTEFGALSIVINAKELDTSLTTLKDYVKKRQQIMDDFKVDKFGQETYDKLMSENDSSLQSALKNAQSYQQAILGIIKSQAKAEQEALFKVIDARKDALKKKKDYYDYDKTLKNKTKEIDLLKQQIAALDGVTDAQSKAEKARLEAELAEKQEDFDDTVKDHVYDLQVEGLDDLKDQLSEDFEKWSHELSANLEKMSQAIADAVKNVGSNTADAMLSIGKILEQFGIKAGDLGISAEDLNVSGLKKYHKGAKRVGKDVLAVTNDGGREIIVTKQGVITPMKSSDGVIPNNMTETLMDMAAFWQNPNFPKYTDMFRVKPVDSNGGNNVVSINYDGPMLQVQGDVTKDTLPDLQTILKKASKYTQNEIRRDISLSR